MCSTGCPACTVPASSMLLTLAVLAKAAEGADTAAPGAPEGFSLYAQCAALPAGQCRDQKGWVGL